jgi:hypothetical protein
MGPAGVVVTMPDWMFDPVICAEKPMGAPRVDLDALVDLKRLLMDPTDSRHSSDDKREARRHRATDQLAIVAPASQDLLVRAAERGDNLGTITAGLMRLLQRYGAAELQAGIKEALDRGVPHTNAVRLALEHRRESRRQEPPVSLILPAHIRDRDAAVRTHSLDTYDKLTEIGHDEA